MSNNPFSDINAKEFIAQVPTNTTPTTTPAAAATTLNGTPTKAATTSATTTPATTAATHPVTTRPYNPNAQLSQLDALALPDETENDRLNTEVERNVKNLITTKLENDRKQQKVGSVLAEKMKGMEEEQRKLAFIRAELLKLDHNLSKNIDMLRAEIEGCGREVNTLQKEFEWKEKEYLSCRKALAKVKQRKLLLTSHLDFIILTNENEKASKLTELELSLGLTPSTPPPMHVIPTIPYAATTSSSSSAPSTAAAPSSPTPLIRNSSGPTPAVAAAAAESEARFAAAQAAAYIPPDHPGLRLDAVAPPVFGGFDPVPEQQQPLSHSPMMATQPSGPSPAQIAASRHVALPPRSNSVTTPPPSATIPPVVPRPAQTPLSISNKNKATPLNYSTGGQFVGFSDE